MRKEQKQALLWVFLAFIGAAMLAGLIAIVLPRRYVSGEVMGTISLVGVYALGGLIVVAISRDMKWTTRIAFVALAISMLVYITFIWFERAMTGRTEDIVFKVGTIALIIGFVCTHRLLVCPLTLHTGIGHLAKRVALISAGVTAAIICLGLIFEGFYRWDDLMIRLLGIALVIAAGSSITTGAIAIFGPRPGEDEPDVIAESIPVRLTCPVCEDQIEAMSNTPGHCGQCKLQIEIRTQELRCACGYLLHQLERDICPECGKPVEAGERWGARQS